MVGAGCNLIEWGTFMRRMDNFLMDLAADKPNVERLLDALMEKHLQPLKKSANRSEIALILCFLATTWVRTGVPLCLRQHIANFSNRGTRF
jgi:hypothetical protein